MLTLTGAAPAALAAQGDMSPAIYPVKVGVQLTSSDGRRLGNVFDVVKGPDGVVTAAQIVVGSTIKTIPASTITAKDARHFETSMTYAAVTR